MSGPTQTPAFNGRAFFGFARARPVFQINWPAGQAAPPGYTQADVSLLPVAQGSVQVDFAPGWSTAPGPAAVLLATFTAASAGHKGIEIYVLPDGTLNFFTLKSDTATTNLASSPLTWVNGQTYRIKAAWGAGNLFIYRDGTLVASNITGSAVMPDGHDELDVGFALISGLPADSATGTLYRVLFFSN